MDLWPHQQSAIKTTLSAIERRDHAGLWSMPTGTGKTVAFATLAERLQWTTLVMVHRDELIRQAINTFADVWPAASVGVIQAERDELDGHDVVVASVPSLHAKRLERIPPDRFGLIVCDEAHHAAAPTWAAVLDRFASRFVLGVTATPERHDGQGLADRLGREPIYSYPLRQAIDDGHLVHLRQYAISTDVDLGGVTHGYGDFSDGELSAAVNTDERNRIITEAFLKHAPERRAIAFCVDVQHATDLCEEFQSAGVNAATVTGSTPKDERRQTLVDFAAGRIQVISNCAVLTEGFDDPGVSAVLMARPTSSRSLYTQCVGRGLRLADGKADCLVLDVTDNSRKHKLVNALDLLGAPNAFDADGGDVIEVADHDIAEAERQDVIESQSPLSWSLESVSPWPSLPNLHGYVVSARWHHGKASDGQLRYLRTFGMNVDRDLTKGEASFLIDRCRDCDAAYPTPATPKQKSYLKWRGAWCSGLTKREASKLIGELKGCE